MDKHGGSKTNGSGPELNVVDDEVCQLTQQVTDFRRNRLERLRDLDLFVLDNSLRESTVGQLRSHTMENKIAIYDQVKKCGMTHIIVACFAHMTRVDDDFCQYLLDKGEDMSNHYSFSEVTEGLSGGRYDTERIPVACLKNKKYGVRNTIFEIDLANVDCEWDTKWTIEDQCQLMMKYFRWTRREVHPSAKLMINLRDFAAAMAQAPGRVLEVVRFLACLPTEERIFGIVYEDLGESLPEELGLWTKSVRKVMDACGWADGHLLIHVHEQWDFQTASTMRCLQYGANGVWASVCEEGAAVGHASSTVTVMNLVRLGNTKVLENYQCVEMRSAAREVTKITTGSYPSPRQVLYGERALDMVFGFPVTVMRQFDMGKFFGVQPEKRITTLASPEMILEKLVEKFGEDPQFTIDIAKAMKETILDDVRSGRKEEYMSKFGLAVLFDRSGGQLSAKMRDILAAVGADNETHKRLIAEVKELWDKWDLNDEIQGDDRLQFDSFYHGFMAPYFGCYRCTTTKKALRALDMDSDGFVDWDEFAIYLKWALCQYPEVCSADDLLDITFQKGLIPAMRDVQLMEEATQDRRDSLAALRFLDGRSPTMV
ncbi:uncharacterized protein LOC135822240 [Sycon ciliatum]|uniref:uncharacterized protein LOC135822240 n=1 Tax=Sycon ciliatum TaxID=27933 RepID=UPI0031F63F33|eukprot:scpid44586/ scgid22256/ 